MYVLAVDDERNILDEPGDGGSALVRDGGVCARVDSDGCCVSALPEGNPSRHCPAKHEIAPWRISHQSANFARP